MIALLDTQLLIWTAGAPDRLSARATAIIADRANTILFSAISIGEIAIKRALDKPDFLVDPHLVRRALLENGYVELGMTSSHALVVATLPPIHRDPFDRILIAQAVAEQVTLLTADLTVGRYPGPINTV